MKNFFLFLIFSLSNPCTAMTLVGLDDSGSEIIQNIPQSEFGSSLRKRALLVYESTQAALDEFHNKQLKNNLTQDKVWDFDRFDIGVGFQASVGIGSLFRATISPSIVLHFDKR